MSRLNYHHLYYFWRVASLGNLTQVARDLNVSQSALSAQIKQLEHNMDINLFERSGRRLKLTDKGRRVLAFTDDIFNKGAELESFLKKGSEIHTQHISIGVLTNLSRNFVEAFISPLLEQANVTFSLVAGGIDSLLNGLTNHELDLLLTNHAVTTGKQDSLWQTQLVSRQPLAIIGPALQATKTAFPEGYADARWVLPSQGTEIRKAFNSLCSLWQFQPKVQAEANDMAMLRLLARDSGALSVLPVVVVKDEIEQRILSIYQELPNAYENFYAVTSRSQFVPDVLLKLLQQQVPLA